MDYPREGSASLYDYSDKSIQHAGYAAIAYGVITLLGDGLAWISISCTQTRRWGLSEIRVSFPAVPSAYAARHRSCSCAHRYPSCDIRRSRVFHFSPQSIRGHGYACLRHGAAAVHLVCRSFPRGFARQHHSYRLLVARRQTNIPVMQSVRSRPRMSDQSLKPATWEAFAADSTVFMHGKVAYLHLVRRSDMPYEQTITIPKAFTKTT